LIDILSIRFSIFFILWV